MGNRLWYTGLGATDIAARSSRGLPATLAVWADGVRVTLPPGTEGVLALNIGSYAGGVDLWAQSAPPPPAGGGAPDTDPPPPQSFGDGELELVAVYGSWHLGQLQVGLSRAVRLARCAALRVRSAVPLAVQVDGEPWMQADPADFTIEATAPARMLRRLEEGPAARLAAAVRDALAAAERKGVVTPAQRAALATEIAATMHRV